MYHHSCPHRTQCDRHVGDMAIMAFIAIIAIIAVAAIAIVVITTTMDDPIAGPQGIQGPAGEQGLQGVPGLNGQDGLNGLNGRDGLNGLNGRDGHMISNLIPHPRIPGFERYYCSEVLVRDVDPEKGVSTPFGPEWELAYRACLVPAD